MTQVPFLMENETLQKLKSSLSHSNALARTPLHAAVREFLQPHFLPVGDAAPTELYELVLAEMEIPLLEMVLQYCGQNQSRAAKLLDISRGNLRQKMQRYGLLPVKRQKYLA